MEFPTVCPHCGLSLAADNSPPLSTTRPDVTDEHTLIQNKLRQLEDTIHYLNTHRITLLRKLNELQSTPRKLPSEILSTIFQYASPPDPLNNLTSPQSSQIVRVAANSSYFPLTLSAVSSRWRKVVQSTPQLWTSIAVEVHSSSGPQTATLLQQYLQFSKMLPISLAIIVQRCNTETDHGEQRNDQVAGLDGYLGLIAHTIFSGYSSRIKRLYLGDPPPGWLPFIRDDFAQLEDLYLDFARRPWSSPRSYGFTPSSPVTFTNIPSLRRLALHSQVNIDFKALGSTLTALRMHLLFPHIAIRHLLSCPHIEEFYFRDPIHPDGWGVVVTPIRVVTLSHLRVLGWPLTATATQRSALSFTYLNLPALEKLCIYIDGSVGSIDIMSDPFTRFLSRVSSTLSTLELVDLGGPVSSLPGIFSKIHPCKLDIIGGRNPDFVPYVIHALTPSLSESHARHLPGLKELCIKDVNLSPGILNQKNPDAHSLYKRNLVCDFIEMIRKRWEGNCAPLRLELSNTCGGLDWTTEARQELNAMIWAGLELEIIDDLRPMEWLNATPQER